MTKRYAIWLAVGIGIGAAIGVATNHSAAMRLETARPLDRSSQHRKGVPYGTAGKSGNIDPGQFE